NLVDRNNGRTRKLGELAEKHAVLAMKFVAYLDHAYDHFALHQASPCRLNHPTVEHAARIMQSRRVYQDHLRIGIAANSNDSPARSLRLGRHNRDLLPDHAVKQR